MVGFILKAFSEKFYFFFLAATFFLGAAFFLAATFFLGAAFLTAFFLVAFFTTI